ncbi:MAG: CBS domain-containing protein [Gammaproteobacteria bacterium]|nr:CBS domain-containing protein [Gammaproteobacteria bacterium]
MDTIRRVLDVKGRAVHTIGPDATVYEAIKLMADCGIGALPVVQGDRLVGIVTERDYARKVVLQDRSSKSTAVREIMTTEVVCVAQNERVTDCMELMTLRRFRHLPVVEDERLIGLVSVGDLVKAVISGQKFVIEQLEQYIQGEIA